MCSATGCAIGDVKRETGLVVDPRTVNGRLAFLMCIEPGWLEAQTCLLAETIRHFAGRYADSEVIAVQPRGTEPLSSETAARLSKLGVRHVAGAWNSAHRDVGTANKVYAAAYAETITSAKTIVFMDSDTVVLGEPDALDLGGDFRLAVSLTTYGSGATTRPGHPLEDTWADAYAACSVAQPPYVPVRIGTARVRGCYNGGLVAWRRSAALGALWLDHLHRVTPVWRSNRRYLDQVALATMAASLPCGPEILPPEYNYNLREHAWYRGAGNRLDLDVLVHAHYHNCFSRPGFLERVRPALNPCTPEYAWLAERLPLSPVEKPWRRPWRHWLFWPYRRLRHYHDIRRKTVDVRALL